MTPLLVEVGLDEVYNRLERPLVPVLVDIERAGVRIDTAALAAQSQRIEKELTARNAQIFQLAGEQFNIGPPPQLSRILLDKLQKTVNAGRSRLSIGAHRGDEVVEEEDPTKGFFDQDR